MGDGYTPERDLNDFMPGDIKGAFEDDLQQGYGEPKAEVDPELGITKITDKNVGKTVIDTMQQTEDIGKD